MTVFKLCGSCRLSKSVIFVIITLTLVIFATRWTQQQKPLLSRWTVKRNLGSPTGNLKVTDAMKFNSNRSVVLKKAKHSGRLQGLKSCPSPGHVKATMDSPLCTNQNKLIVYSKLRNDFPAAWFREYQKSAVDCELPGGVKCFYTEDDSLYSTADVLYIHECFSHCETPAYPEQIVVRYNLGPELYLRQCNNRTTHAADIRVNYHITSTIPWLYLCFPETKQPVMDALRLGTVPSNRHGIAMFVSDCHSKFSQWRSKYLKELMKYIEIDSYGNCFHNTVINQTRQDPEKFNIKVDVLKKKQYKFLIAFENSQVSEYITEKIWHAYMSQTIPIYYGAPEIYKQVPGRNTFIDASNFAGPKQLAEYIKEVDGNKKLYQSFFDFDTSNFENFEKTWCSEIPLSCQVCNKAYEVKQSRCNMQ